MNLSLELESQLNSIIVTVYDESGAEIDAYEEQLGAVREADQDCHPSETCCSARYVVIARDQVFWPG